MRFILIRHGKTAGNLEGRYIGCRTDEPLCEQGIEALRRLAPPPVDRVFCSPMRRCIETAAILYPDHQPVLIDDFRECDFGAFEGRNYAELNGLPEYQAWIDSNGELPFPGGESREDMVKRVSVAFSNLISDAGSDTCAVIAHGGTIMSIMSQFALPPMPYFSYQLKNGDGFTLNSNSQWRPGFVENALLLNDGTA